ncbi:MAG: hypothetical protein ACK5O1_03765 [Holosporales bacterium]
MTVTLDNSSKVSGSFDATLYTSTDSTYVLEWNGKYYRVGSAGSLTIIDDPDKSNLTKSPNFSNRLEVYQQNSMVYFVDREQIYKIEVTTTTNNGTLNTESSIVVVPSNLSPTNTSSLSGGSVDPRTVTADLNGATVTVYTPTTPALGTQNNNTIYLATNNKIIYSYNTGDDSIAYIGTSLPAGVAVTQAFPGTSFQVISNTDGRRYLYANGTVYEPDFQNGSLVLVPKTTTNGTNGTLGGISILNTIGGGLGGLGGLNSTDLGDTLNNPVTKILTAAEVAPTELNDIQDYFQLFSSIILGADGIRGLFLGDNDKVRTIPNPTTIGTIGSSGSDSLTPPSPTTTEASTGGTTTTKVEQGTGIVLVSPEEYEKIQASKGSNGASSTPSIDQNLTGAPDPVATATQKSSSQKTKDTPDDKPSATSNKEPKKQTIASAPVESTPKEKSQSIPTNPSTNKKPEQSSDGGNGTETNVNKNKKGIVDKGTLVLDMKDRENPLEVHFTLDGKKLIANKFTIEKGNIVIDAGTKVTIPLTKLSMVNLAALGDKLEDKYIVKQGDQHFTLTKPTNAFSSYKLTATESTPKLVANEKRFDIDGDGKAENTDPINLKWAMNQTSTGGGGTVTPKTENPKKEQNQITSIYRGGTSTGGGGHNKNETSATVNPNTKNPKKEQNQITSIHTGSVPNGKYHWAYIGNKLNLVSPAGNPVDYLVEGGKIYVSGKDNQSKPVAIELTSSNYDWNIPTGVPKEIQLAGGDKITLDDWKVDTEELKKNGKNSGEFDGDARPSYTGVPTGITQKNLPPASGPITVASAANLTNALAGNPLGGSSATSPSGESSNSENSPQLTSIT